MPYNIRSTGYALTVPSANDMVEPLDARFDQVFSTGPEGVRQAWQAQMMVVVRADSLLASKALLVKRLREMASDIENAEILTP